MMKDRGQTSSALLSQIEEKETKAGVLAFIYVAGLVAVPALLFLVAANYGGSKAGGMLLLLYWIVYAQRKTVVHDGPLLPSTLFEEEPIPEHAVIPLFYLGRPLEALLERLAHRVGAPVPALVYVSPFAFAAGWIPQFKIDLFNWGITWVPVMFLGVVPMRTLKREEFEAIVAHELGHLSRRPGFLQGFIMGSIRLAEEIDTRRRGSTLQAWLNPGCLWTRLWMPVLDCYVAGVGRLEELYADAEATRAVGAEPMVRALDVYITNICQVRSLAQRHLEKSGELHTALNEYFKQGPAALPPTSDPAVAKRLAQFHERRDQCHPTNRARAFMIQRASQKGETLADPSTEGCLYLLPDKAREFLPVVVRFLTRIRHQLAETIQAERAPWSVCQGERSKLKLPADEDLPRWKRTDDATSPDPAPQHLDGKQPNKRWLPRLVERHVDAL